MVRPARFERAAFGSGGQRSIQLSYERIRTFLICFVLAAVKGTRLAQRCSRRWGAGLRAAAMWGKNDSEGSCAPRIYYGGECMRDVLVGVSGASGMPLALCLMRLLAAMPEVRTHCVVSDGARAVLRAECGAEAELLTSLAHATYAASDLGAGPASGSWWRRGSEPAAMLLVPCSMGTAGAIASGATRNLVHRAADVALKERLPLVLVTRESPLSAIHLRNMLTLREAGAVVMPFSPGFYLRPLSLEAMLEQFCGRILDQVGLAHDIARWTGQTAPDA